MPRQIHLHFEEGKTDDNRDILRCIVLDYEDKKPIAAYKLSLSFDGGTGKIGGTMLSYVTHNGIIQVRNGRQLQIAEDALLCRVTSDTKLVEETKKPKKSKSILGQLIDFSVPEEPTETRRGIDMD